MPDIVRQTSGGAAADFVPVITITPVADQDDTSDVTLSLATVTLGGEDESGNVTAYAWRIDGATTGLDDATAASPVLSPTAFVGKTYVATCSVTIGGQVYTSSPEVFRVGDANGLVTQDISSTSLTWADGSVTGLYVSAVQQGDGSTIVTLDGDVAARADGVTEAATATLTGLYAAGTRVTLQWEILGTRSNSWAFLTAGIHDTTDNTPANGAGIGDESGANEYRLAFQTSTANSRNVATGGTAKSTLVIEVGENDESSNAYARAYDASGNLLNVSNTSIGFATALTTGRFYVSAGFANVPNAGNQTIQGRLKVRRDAL